MINKQNTNSPQKHQSTLDLDQIHIDCLFQELASYANQLHEEALTQSIGLKKVLNNLMIKKQQKEVEDATRVDLSLVQNLICLNEELSSSNEELEEEKKILMKKIDSLEIELLKRNKEVKILKEGYNSLQSGMRELRKFAYLGSDFEDGKAKDIHRLIDANFFDEKFSKDKIENLHLAIKILVDEGLKMFKVLRELKENNSNNMIEVAHYLTEIIKGMKEKLRRYKKSDEASRESNRELSKKLKRVTLKLRENDKFLKKLQRSNLIPLSLHDHLECLIHQNKVYFNPKDVNNLTSLSINLKKEIEFLSSSYLRDSTMIQNNNESMFQDDLEISEIAGFQDESFITIQDEEDKDLDETIILQGEQLEVERAREEVRSIKEILTNILETSQNARFYTEIIHETESDLHDTNSLEKKRRTHIVSTLESYNEKLNQSLSKLDSSMVEREKKSTAGKIARGILKFFSKGIEALTPEMEAFDMDPNNL